MEVWCPKEPEERGKSWEFSHFPTMKAERGNPGRSHNPDRQEVNAGEAPSLNKLSSGATRSYEKRDLRAMQDTTKVCGHNIHINKGVKNGKTIS